MLEAFEKTASLYVNRFMLPAWEDKANADYEVDPWSSLRLFLRTYAFLYANRPLIAVPGEAGSSGSQPFRRVGIKTPC